MCCQHLLLNAVERVGACCPLLHRAALFKSGETAYAASHALLPGGKGLWGCACRVAGVTSGKLWVLSVCAGFVEQSALSKECRADEAKGTQSG